MTVVALLISFFYQGATDKTTIAGLVSVK